MSDILPTLPVGEVLPVPIREVDTSHGPFITPGPEAETRGRRPPPAGSDRGPHTPSSRIT